MFVRISLLNVSIKTNHCIFCVCFRLFVYIAKVAFWTWDGSIVSDSLTSILSDSKMLKQKEQKSIPEFCKQCVKNGDPVQGSFQYLLF
jgi:hypothetical protein